MTLSVDEVNFLTQMAEQLDETIKDLDKQQERMQGLLGDARVLELHELWEGTYGEGARDIAETIDYHDRELFGLWAKKDKAADQRLRLGRRLMIMGVRPR